MKLPWNAMWRRICILIICLWQGAILNATTGNRFSLSSHSNNTYEFQLQLDSASELSSSNSPTTLYCSSIGCNQSFELSLTSAVSSKTPLLIGRTTLSGDCGDWVFHYSYLSPASLIYYSFTCSLQDLLLADEAGWLVSATPANGSYNQLLAEAKEQHLPDSELSGYLQYRSQMNSEILQGTWNTRVAQLPLPAGSSCTNADFETGDMSGWTGATGLNPGCCLTPGIIAGRQTIMSGPGLDPCGGFPVVCPGGSYSLRLGNNVSGGLAEQISQTFTVSASSTNFTYKYAVVLQDPGHPASQQPFFKVEMLDQSGNEIPCALYFVAAGQGIPGFQSSTTCASVVFKPWTSVSIDLSAYVGQSVTVRFTAADCTLGGHYGYAYIDGNCMPLALTSTGDVCQGGSVTLTAPVGSAAYSWSPGGQTTPSITVTTSGTYSCTLTSVQGCNVTLSIPVVIYPNPVAAFGITQTPCSPSFSFTDSAYVSSGTITSTSWNFGDLTTSSLTNPTHLYGAPGTYTVSLTVTTALGCTATITHPVVVPVPVTNVLSVVPVSCFGGITGSAGVIASGGQSPYTYSWSNGAVTSVNPSLSAGNYTVLVTDAKGCSTSGTVTVTQPPAMVHTITSTSPSCFGFNNGSAVLNVSGGTPGYQYSWSTTPPQTLPTANGLSAGTYSCTVKDANGCISVSVTNLIAPPILVGSTLVTDVSCFGGNSGTIQANVTGGTTPYTYSWNTSLSTLPVLSGLAAGNYQLTITDHNGCSTVVSSLVAQPPVLTGTVTGNNVTCNGLSNGSASALVSGGTLPYTYSWNTIPAQTGPSATNLGAGVYSAFLKDGKGCTAVVPVTLTQPAPLVLSMSPVIPVSCHGGTNGSATVIPTGGTSPYSYSWNSVPPQNSSTASNLPAGTYLVNVQDANHCNTVQTVQILQPAALLATPSSVSPLCNGGSNGSASVTVSGGTTLYSYSWNTTPPQTSQTATGLLAGTYSCTIRDANGCILVAAANLSAPAVLTGNTTITDVSCFGGNSGTIQANVTGGTLPYSYSWNTSLTGLPVLSGLTAGSYLLTVTDHNGCTAVVPSLVNQPLQLTGSVSVGAITCNGAANGSASVAASGGTLPYTYSWNTVPPQTGSSANNLVAGIYAVLIKDGKGCTVSAPATLVQPAPLVLSVGPVTGVSCPGGADGSATALTSGGTPPYSYSWNTVPSQSTSSVIHLQAGTYLVTIQDANKCSIIQSVPITQPAALLANPSFVSPLCNGGSNGNASATASGGTPPYNYTWNTVPVQTGPMASNLPAGTYSLTVIDSKGCQTLQKVVLTQPSAVISTLQAQSPVCYGATTGSVSAVVSGGTPPYLYSWNSSGSQGPALSGLGAGTYYLHVLDAHGCTTVVSTTLTQPPQLLSNLLVSNETCYGGTNAWMKSTAQGGTAPYHYSWSTVPAQTGSTISGLAAGSYSLLLTDQEGCRSLVTGIVLQPPAVNLRASGDTTLCAGQYTRIFAQASGGDGSYVYSWENGAGNVNAQVVSPAHDTVYIVHVTDNAGCAGPIDTIHIGIHVLNAGNITVTPPSGVCIGSGISISAGVTGNTGPVTYIWYNLPGNPTGPGPYQVTPTTTTTYSVMITNACGAIQHASIPVTVHPLPVIALVPQRLAACSNATLTMTNQATNNGASYNWSFGDGASSTLPAPQHQYPASGAYTVLLTLVSADGCVNTGHVVDSVVVYAPSIAAFISPDRESELTPSIAFTNESVNAENYAWDFGDHSTSNGVNPVHTYARKGVYEITLYTRSAKGCPDSTKKVIEIFPEFSYYIPNAFTPNADGENDVFNGKGEEVADFNMLIFDRWGQMIYTTTDKDRGWDGRANGGSEIAQIDVYVYKITLHDFQGNRHDYIGSVSLIK